MILRAGLGPAGGAAKPEVVPQKAQRLRRRGEGGFRVQTLCIFGGNFEHARAAGTGRKPDRAVFEERDEKDVRVVVFFGDVEANPVAADWADRFACFAGGNGF